VSGIRHTAAVPPVPVIPDTDPEGAPAYMRCPMEGRAAETAYFLNGKLPRIALIAKGVRFPEGQWVRLVGDQVPPALVQDVAAELFPALGDRRVPIATLLTDFDVEEFEREMEGDPGRPFR